MRLAANILIGLVAFAHRYFVVLEMFLWKTPFGRRVFGLSKEDADKTAALAMNQGLYNGSLVPGLVWGNKRILFVQAVPGAIAATLLFLATR